MRLPELPEVSPEIARAIAARHGLAVERVARLPEVGIFNAVYLLDDDLVLRVPRKHPAFVAALRTEALVVPAARAAGVHTPAIVARDDTLDLLPVPCLIYERVHGETLGLDPAATPGVWRALGRDLARLHTGVTATGPIAGLALDALPDPRPWPADLARDGYITSLEAHWLTAWLERLTPMAQPPRGPRLLHGDVQATNVMIRTDDGEPVYLALLDWGAAGWGDPAWDFAGLPLRVAPLLLEGYRAVAPLDGDDTAEARILWRQLQLALWLLRRPPQPGRAWAERPLAMLLEVLHFMADPPAPWRALRL